VDENDVLALVARLQDEYDTTLDDESVDRWIRALADQAPRAMNIALDKWIASDHGYRQPAPADLKRLSPDHMGSRPRTTGKSSLLHSGVTQGEDGEPDGIIYHGDGGWWFIPRDQINAKHLAGLREAMKREGVTIPEMAP
jgi:hypothetical protein